jgi:hypothetical protein
VSVHEIHAGNALDRDLVLEGDVAVVGTEQAARSAPRSWRRQGSAS